MTILVFLPFVFDPDQVGHMYPCLYLPTECTPRRLYLCSRIDFSPLCGPREGRDHLAMLKSAHFWDLE